MSLFLPKPAIELGLNSEDYIKIAENIKRISSIPLEKREEILNRGGEKINYPLEKIKRLSKIMEYDKYVYSIAKLKYHKGPPTGQKLFITSLVDYLLRKNDLKDNE